MNVRICLSQIKDAAPMFWRRQRSEQAVWRREWRQTLIERELSLFLDARTRDIRKYKGHRVAYRFLLCRPIGMAFCTWGKAVKAASAFPHLLPF
jgi:hypothetical protein